MTKQEFFIALQDILQCDDVLSEDTVLTDREDWDSLSVMTLIAFFDKNFNQRIKFDEFRGCRRVGDVIALGRGAII